MVGCFGTRAGLDPDSDAVGDSPYLTIVKEKSESIGINWSHWPVREGRPAQTADISNRDHLAGFLSLFALFSGIFAAICAFNVF